VFTGRPVSQLCSEQLDGASLYQTTEPLLRDRQAAEAAAAQGAFWEMHDTLLRHQGALQPTDLVRYATELRLNTERFVRDLRDHAFASRVAEDVETADLGSVSGTPTFFINGQRHYGSYDVDSLKQAVRTARALAAIAA
jgi:protein-disulfide isomerase